MQVGSYRGQGFELLFQRDGGQLTVGKYTSIGDFVTVFLGGQHHHEWVTTSPLNHQNASYSRGDVRIGNDVWIGHRVTIMDGVEIGDGAVVGACSVVTKDVEPYAIVAGNPSRFIRLRFSRDTVQSLLDIAWWDWPEDVVMARRDDLLQPDIEAFIRKYGQNA